MRISKIKFTRVIQALETITLPEPFQKTILFAEGSFLLIVNIEWLKLNWMNQVKGPLNTFYLHKVVRK